MPKETITFRCSKCNKKLRVPEDWTGRKVKCPRCDKPTRVTEDGDLDMSAFHEAINEAQSTKKKKGKVDRVADERLAAVASLEPVVNPDPIAVPQPSAKKQKCPFCGGEVLETAKKCRHCSEWLQPPSPNAQLPSVKDKSGGVLKRVVLVVVVLAIAVVGAWWWYYNIHLPSQINNPVAKTAATPSAPASIKPEDVEISGKELVTLIKVAWREGGESETRRVGGGTLTFFKVESSKDIAFPFVLIAIYEIRIRITDQGTATYKVGFDERLNMSENYSRINDHYKLYDNDVVTEIKSIFREARVYLRSYRKNVAKNPSNRFMEY